MQVKGDSSPQTVTAQDTGDSTPQTAAKGGDGDGGEGKGEGDGGGPGLTKTMI